MNGKVYAVSCETGELVSTQQVFALIGERDEFIIELMIDEVDIARVQLNQKVVLSLDAYAGRVFEATISKIYPTKEERTQTFRVEATFETKPENLYNGLSGEANIIVSEAESVMTIPLEYLSDDGTVKTKSGEELRVETGRQNMELVEITSGIDTNTVIVKP
jgi:multidrug efflux pump subunit AcrA (membrane-fusion protein)